MAAITLLQSCFISPRKYNKIPEMGLSELLPGGFYDVGCC